MIGSAADSSANFNNDTQDQTVHSTRGSISDYDRRVNAFNQKMPPPAAGKGLGQSRVTSWSDPISAKEFLDGDEVEYPGRTRSHSGSRARRTWSRSGRVSFGTDDGNGEEGEFEVIAFRGDDDAERRR